MTEPPRLPALSLALLVGCLPFLFWGVITKLVADWRADENYSHGFLVVPFAAHVVWHKRRELAGIPERPLWAGLLLILASQAVLAASVALRAAHGNSDSSRPFAGRRPAGRGQPNGRSTRARRADCAVLVPFARADCRQRMLHQIYTVVDAIRLNPSEGAMVRILVPVKGSRADAEREAGVSAVNLAWLYGEQGENLDVALQLAQAAKRQIPDRAEVDDPLRWVHDRKGLDTLALKSFEEGVRNNPATLGYQFHLGLAYLKTGDLTKAKGARQKAQSQPGTFDGAGETKTLLVGLE